MSIPGSPSGLWVLAVALFLSAPTAEAQSEISSHPCMMALANGSLEERRARFPAALMLFEQARKESVCEVEAQIGIARTLNSMNDHKEALVAAEWVVERTEDPELLAEAHYEIGRAHHKPGRKMNKAKTAAEAAYKQAIESSEGRHRAAVRALMRLYQETKQEETLAELHERYPDIRSSTRSQQLRKIAPRRRKAASDPVATWPTATLGSANCQTRDSAPDVWELEIPRFCGSDSDDYGQTQPRKIEVSQPQYPDEDRKARTQGTVLFEALVDENGDVEAIRIVDGVSPGLDAATIDSACRWRWQPLMENGQASRYYICGSTNFRLQ